MLKKYRAKELQRKGRSLGGTSSCIIVRLGQIYAKDVGSPSRRFAISRRATKLKQETFAGENW